MIDIVRGVPGSRGPCWSALLLAAAWSATAQLAAAQGAEGDAERFVGTDVPLAVIEASIRDREPLLFKPVGSTSVVFRMRLAGDFDAAFKPRTRSHPRGARAEVAAYRIARALGMPNVPPAVPRSVPLAKVEGQLLDAPENEWESLREQILSGADGRVHGTAIYWIPKLRELGIDTERGIERWSRWLSQQEEPPFRDKSRVLAEQISNMIAFDYLIGNWDRFSGANAQGDERGRNLIVRDHNVAFYEPLPAMQHRRLMARLQRIQRFSRDFVVRLKALTPEALEQVLSQPGDPSGYSPLSDEQLEALLQRRRALLSYIAALIDQHGEAAVLSFP